MTIHRLLASGLRQSASTNREYCYEAGNSPDRTARRIASSAMIGFPPRQHQNHHKFHQNQRHAFRPCAFPAWLFQSLQTSTSLMTYLSLPINSAMASQSLILVFQTPHPLVQLAKRFIVSVFSSDLSSAKPACTTPPQHPIPAQQTIFIF